MTWMPFAQQSIQKHHSVVRYPVSSKLLGGEEQDWSHRLPLIELCTVTDIDKKFKSESISINWDMFYINIRFIDI